jgi:hypothetical protein
LLWFDHDAKFHPSILPATATEDAYYRRNVQGGTIDVVPASYTTYFATVTGAAAALIGLLFVSVSLRPDTVFGDAAPERGRTLAASAFTGLVNTFFLAMFALLPNSNLGYPAVVLALSSLASTFSFRGKISHSPTQQAYLLLSTIAFTFQVVEGVYLIVQPRGNSGVEGLSYFLIGSMVLALARAWALLQGKHMESPKTAPVPSAPAE